MPFTIIQPKTARPVANYAMAARVESGRLIYTGTVGPVQSDGRVACPGDIGGQTRHVYQALSDRLADSACGLNDIIRLTTYLADMADFKSYADARAPYLPGRMPPATLIQVSGFTQPEVLVQVDAVAVTS